MSKEDLFKKDLLLLLFKHQATIHAYYEYDRTVIDVSLESEKYAFELPTEINTHTKLIQ